MPPRKRAATQDAAPKVSIAPDEAGNPLLWIDDESFRMRPVVPGAVILDYMMSGDSELKVSRATYAFFDAVIDDDPTLAAPTDLARFNTRLRAQHRAIDLEQVFEISELLVEHYSERPTRSPRRTATPRRGTGGGSTVSRSGRG